MEAERTLTAMFDGKNLPVALAARAFSKFTAMLATASKTVMQGKGRAEWLLTDLRLGSLIISATPDVEPRLESYRQPLVAHVRDIAQKVATGKRQGVTTEEWKRFDELRGILNGRVTGLTIVTEQNQAALPPLKTATHKGGDANAPAEPMKSALGVVVGKAQTLSSRNALMFTVFDLKTDEAVLCYATQDQHEWLDGILDKTVEVEGEIARDPITGRPKIVREINRITPVEPLEDDALERLAGIFEGKMAMTPEEAVRRVRNGEV